jgi:hypothetical protein
MANITDCNLNISPSSIPGSSDLNVSANLQLNSFERRLFDNSLDLFLHFVVMGRDRGRFVTINADDILDSSSFPFTLPDPCPEFTTIQKTLTVKDEVLDEDFGKDEIYVLINLSLNESNIFNTGLNIGGEGRTGSVSGDF